MNDKKALYALSKGRTVEEQIAADEGSFTFNYLVWLEGMKKRFVKEQDDEFHGWLMATVAMDTVLVERHNT